MNYQRLKTSYHIDISSLLLKSYHLHPSKNLSSTTEVIWKKVQNQVLRHRRELALAKILKVVIKMRSNQGMHKKIINDIG